MRYRHPTRVDYAQFYKGTPGFARPKKVRGRRALGIAYERKAHEHFGEVYGAAYLPSPWIIYRREGEAKEFFAQPDALLIEVAKTRIVIIEYKFQHTPDAYYKLVNLYEPLIRHMFGRHWQIALCECVRWYDRAIWFPSRIQLRDGIHKAKVGEIAVHIWAG